MVKRKIRFYCKALEVSRQAFYDYLERKDKPWKYQSLADEMMRIHNEDTYNDCYGRARMYQALLLKKAEGKTDIDIPSEGTVRKVMEHIGLIHKPRRKPNGITKADREARKSDDLLKRDFSADKPLEKAVTDISELKAKDGKSALRMAVFRRLLKESSIMKEHLLQPDHPFRLLSGRCGYENGYFYEYDRIYSTFILTRASIQV